MDERSVPYTLTTEGMDAAQFLDELGAFVNRQGGYTLLGVSTIDFLVALRPCFLYAASVGFASHPLACFAACLVGHFGTALVRWDLA